jgi:hypothetical protein
MTNPYLWIMQPLVLRHISFDQSNSSKNQSGVGCTQQQNQLAPRL